jgi:hypothetical protein
MTLSGNMGDKKCLKNGVRAESALQISSLQKSSAICPKRISIGTTAGTGWQWIG